MKTRIRSEAAAIWQIAWPVLIGQLATVGMGVADVAMTGHFNSEELAAVSLGASLWTIVMVTVMGVMMVVNAMVSHEIGAGALGRVPRMIRQSLWMGLLIGVVGMVALNALTLVFGHLDLAQAVHEKAARYVYVISTGLPAFAMYRALYGYTTSLNQTKPVMLIAVFGLGFNVLMNWLLIYGHFGFPQLGSTGCAVATSAGLWLMLAAMLLWVRRAEVYRATYPFRHLELPRWHEIGTMLRLGWPIGVTHFAEVSAFSAVGLLVARFGVVPVSANQIALNFSSLLFMVPLSVGIALTTRVGQTLGEGDVRQARFISWLGVSFSLGFAILSASFVALLREPIAAMYTSDPEVQEMAATLLLFAAIFQLSDAAQVVASCAVRGYKVTRTPMLIHLVAFYGLALPLGCALGLAPDWLPWKPAVAMGAEGFWIGLILGLTVAGGLLLAYLQRISSQRIRMAVNSGKIAG